MFFWTVAVFDGVTVSIIITYDFILAGKSTTPSVPPNSLHVSGLWSLRKLYKVVRKVIKGKIVGTFNN